MIVEGSRIKDEITDFDRIERSIDAAKEQSTAISSGNKFALGTRSEDRQQKQKNKQSAAISSYVSEAAASAATTHAQRRAASVASPT